MRSVREKPENSDILPRWGVKAAHSEDFSGLPPLIVTFYPHTIIYSGSKFSLAASDDVSASTALMVKTLHSTEIVGRVGVVRCVGVSHSRFQRR